MANALDFAKEYNLARIGSAVNYLTREAHLKVHAFDMLKLNAAGLITQGSDVMLQSIQAHAYSTYSQDASMSSRATKFSIKTPLTKGGLEHHTTTSNSQLDTANGMSLTIDAAYRNNELQLLEDISEAVLYGCAGQNFQEALTKLVLAQNVLTQALAQPDSTARQEAHQAWQRAYGDFTKTYGHGFVSGLKLISCATGEIQMSYQSSGNQQQQRHGHSISGARKGIGASHASEWAKEHTQNQSDGNLSQKAAALPSGSPCEKWVSDCMTSWVASGLAKIAAAPPSVPPAPATGATAPEIPDVKQQPEEKTLPPVTLTNPDDMVKYMQYEQMQADGVDITKTTWQQYQDQIENDTSKLDKDTVSQDGKQLGTSASAWPDSDQRGVIGEGAGMADAVNDVNFGGYAIYDIEVTAYKDVFPSLKWSFHAAPSRAGLYLAKIHMFIMTRQLIGSYLNFLSSLPPEITGGSITSQEVGVFGDILKRCTEYVSTNWIASGDSYRKAVDYFDKILSEESKDRFKNGIAVYNCFVANFKCLSNAPYGFLLTAKRDGKTFYPKWDTWAIDTTNARVGGNGGGLTQWAFPAVSTGKLVEDSYRVFPIVMGGDAPGIGLVFFVPQNQGSEYWSWVGIQADGVLQPGRMPDIWEFLDLGSRGLVAGSRKSYPNCDNQLSVLIYKNGAYPGNAWFGDKTARQYDVLPVTLTPIDHKTVDYGSIHGIPMWYQLPFDLVKKSVLGGFGKEVEVED